MPAPTPFVLTLLHFNLQYCAGGLDGFYTDFPTDNDSIEDQIIVESFQPVLDLLEAHPDWSFDLELQGYMIEVLATRHHDVLDQLRTLAKSGQVELVSFHYSDQLWTAFPWRDQEVSLALTRDLFEAYDLPLSDVVFTQEGQFAEGMLRRMPDAGYHIAVAPKNLLSYEWGHDAEQPLYTYGDGTADDVIVLPGGAGYTGPDGRWTVEWSFLNDGELYATGGLDPYLGPAFTFDAEGMAAHEADLEAREAAGAHIVSVSAYVDAVRDDAVTPLPPVVDGTWQPDDTDNLYRWMGGHGIWADTEADNLVRTTNVQSRHAVAAAEAIDGADDALLQDAWKEVLLGEVSDATGWNPYYTEVQYALDHAAAGEALAEQAIAGPCADNDATSVVVDLTSGTVTWDGSVNEMGTPGGEAWLEPTSAGRGMTTEWGTVSSDVETLVVHLAAGEDPADVVFPFTATAFVTMPALLEDVVSVDGADLVADPLGLPLPTGLVMLSDGVWLVERTDHTHLAARVSFSAQTLSFVDETTQGAAVDWSFLVVRGDEARAREVALATNVYPVVTLTCPPVEETEGPIEKAADCASAGCATADGAPTRGALLAWLGLLGWVGARRATTGAPRRPRG